MNDPLFSLQDKIVILTGGMGRLGREYTKCLQARGARVVVLDRAEAIANAVPSDSLLPLAANVLIRAELESALKTIEQHWGTPTGLINNAALDSPPNSPAEENGPFETYPEKSWDAVMDVNVKGVFLCCQVFGGAMAVAGEAWIRNKGLTEDATSPESYFRLLDALPKLQRLPEETKIRALKYAYHFFFRRMIPLRIAEQVPGTKRPFTMVADSLADFSDHADPGLGVICRGIMDGTPFVYQAEDEVALTP